jgi:uncharacterized protein YecT (DUF1311 family)
MQPYKLTILSVMMFGWSFCSIAQRDITDADLKKINQKIDFEAAKVHKKLLDKAYDSDFQKLATIEFQTDTLRIEMMLVAKMDIDYSTPGITQAAYDAELDYDKLLNKYYQLLMKRLADPDKETLKQSQRAWVQFRDVERKLNGALSKDQYSGGGTMQQITEANEYLWITKKRVIELFGHVSRIVM